MADVIQKLRLANIAGLDANSPQHNIALEEALRGIHDVEAFFEFFREHRESVAYATKPERLDIIAAHYKSHQSCDLDGDFYDRLAAKVQNVRRLVRNEIDRGTRAPFRSIRYNGERYFSIEELTALSTLGSPSWIIELSYRGDLADELRKSVKKLQNRKKVALNLANIPKKF